MKHQGFYETAAQILPVLLLAIVLEARLFRRVEEEEEAIHESLWIVGFVGAMVVGEVLALDALFERRDLSKIENAVIWAAIFYAVVVVALAPIATRVRALRASLPGWLRAVIENLLLLGVVVIVLLAATNIVSDRVIGIIAAYAALLLLIGASALSFFARSTRTH